MAHSLNLSKAKISRAIDAIARGEAVPVDTTRVLIDHDSEANLPDGIARLKYCRHMVSNSSLSMPATLADRASSFRGVCGASAFSFQSFFSMMSCGFVQEQYQLSIDDKSINQDGISTALMMISNGKYANGGMLINPFAALNDGLIDITWINDPSW